MKTKITSLKRNFIIQILLLTVLLINNYHIKAQVLINEVMFMPGSNYSSGGGGDNTNSNYQAMYNSSASTSGSEWIELYNSNPCQPIDLGCYVIGSHTSSSSRGAFSFPPGTIIPPLGFLVIGGTNAPNVDINLNLYNGTQYLTGSTRWHLENGCGYLMLADPSGQIVDAVYWSQNDASDLTATNSCGGSFDNSLPIPSASCNPLITPLMQAKDIMNIEYAGNFGATAQGTNVIGKTISRSNDGNNTWVISGVGGTPGTCNGICQTNNAFTINAQIQNPTCGNNNGSIILNPNPNGSYTYSWSHDNLLLSNTAIGLSTGVSYNVSVSSGSCTKDTTITLSSIPNFNLSINKMNSTCGNSNGQIIVTPSPNGVYSYSWSHDNTITSNSINNLSVGNYTVHVSDGICTIDSTISIVETPPFQVGIQIVNVTCSQNDGQITIIPSLIGSYNYIWSHNNLLNASIASNLPFGSYNVQISDGTCSLDTNINLVAPIGCCNVNLSGIIDSTANTVCNGTNDPCNYSGPTIMINEINLLPSVGDGSIYGPGPTGPGSGEGEWIELFNPNWCDTIDISGYILGTYNSTGSLSQPASNGSAFILPNNTKVPPLGFVVVRGSNAPTPPSGVIDIVVSNNNNLLCIDGGVSTNRIWFQNAGGWFAFYDKNGVPQDVVKWGNPTPSDLNGNPCIPSNNSLPGNVTQLASCNSSGIAYMLGTAILGQNYVRIPDGGSWSSITASENSTYGTCNVVGGCVSQGGASSTCNGTATITMTNGQAPYTYQWDDVLAQNSATADSLCVGTYHVTVTDANGCSEVFEINVIDSLLTFNASSTDPTCGNQDGSITITTNPVGSYNYVWSSNANINNTTSSNASQLAGGTYTVQISSPTCVLDTTIDLQSFIPITDFDVVTISEKCNQANGSINISNVVGGTSPYEYTINGQNSTSNGNYNGLNSGSYLVEIQDVNDCEYSETIVLNEIEGPSEIDYKLTNTLCGESIGLIEILGAKNGVEPYSFSFENQQLSSLKIDALAQGSYTLKVEDSNDCFYETLVEIGMDNKVTNVFIPNVITINDDDVNDLWQVKVECVKSIECQVFNRWGHLIHTYTDLSGYWDGKENGQKVTDGVYYYKVNVGYFDETYKELQGFITVFNSSTN